MRPGQECDWCNEKATHEKNGEHACRDHVKKLDQESGWRD